MASSFKDTPPGELKRLAKAWPSPPGWPSRKKQVMLDLLREKFRHGSTLAKKLLETGHDEIVIECYHHDNYWEDCQCRVAASRCTSTPYLPYGRWDECETPGVNMLGQLLTRVREELRELKDADTAAGDVVGLDGKLL